MKNVVAVVLGGGRGTRLLPLTAHALQAGRAAGGKYRLIDIPISNCINSGINRIYVLTQFQSVSLHRHIRGTYRFDNFSGGFVEILAAQQTMESDEKHDWYQGTADAVRKNLRYLVQPEIEYVLILSGDQLYRMDFRDMLATHEAAKADVTIAAMPVSRSEAGALGIMRVDDTGRVVGFLEKPQTDAELNDVAMDPQWIEARGIESRGRDCLASMGIYLFNRDTLLGGPRQDELPRLRQGGLPGLDALAARAGAPVRRLLGRHRHDPLVLRREPAARAAESAVRSGLGHSADLHAGPLPAADARRRRDDPAQPGGRRLRDRRKASRIENSVIGLRCRIGRDVTIRNSVIMGADYYETPAQLSADRSHGWPPIGIGDGAVIEGAIVDKNCHVGAGAQVIGDPHQIERIVGENWEMLDGIIVVPKNAVLGRRLAGSRVRVGTAHQICAM